MRVSISPDSVVPLFLGYLLEGKSKEDKILLLVTLSFHPLS